MNSAILIFVNFLTIKISKRKSKSKSINHTRRQAQGKVAKSPIVMCFFRIHVKVLKFKIPVRFHIHFHPHPCLPLSGKEQNLSPLGENERG